MTIADDQTNLSPYLRGNYAPIDDELDVDDLPVTGELPEGLDGLYLRNGPNPAFPPVGRYHLFDGDGMLHGVELHGGKASYRNRWVRSKGLGAERRAGRALYGGLSEFVAPDPELVGDAGGFKNTANTNIVRHAGRYLALMEAGPPTEVTRELATVGEYDFGGALEGPMTAHPKWDAATGELLFFGYSAIPPYLRYHVADASGRLVRSVDIDLPRSVMMHDFVVTERWAVFFDLPAVFDLESMFAGGPIISWRPEFPARIGLLDRSGDGDVQWFELDPFYVFHFLNGFDTDDGKVVVDGCRAPHLPVAFGDEVLDPCLPTLHRWTIDPVAGTVAESQLDDRFGDFPRIDDDRQRPPDPLRVHGPRTARRRRNDAVHRGGEVRPDHRFVVGARVRPRPRGRRGGVRPRPRRLRRGRRLAARHRPRPHRGHQRAGRGRRPGPHRRAGRPGADATAGAVRLPRQLAGRLTTDDRRHRSHRVLV